MSIGPDAPVGTGVGAELVQEVTVAERGRAPFEEFFPATWPDLVAFTTSLTGSAYGEVLDSAVPAADPAVLDAVRRLSPSDR